MTAILTTSGTTLEIGPVAADSVNTASAYAALTPYVLVTGVESYGDIGDEQAPITFNEVGSGRISKAKGSSDAGTLAVVTAYLPTDQGQIAMEAAQASKMNYAFRLTYPDGSKQYFRGLVMSKRRNLGTADNVLKRTFNVGINSALVDVAAS